jgi:hypothetical protein
MNARDFIQLVANTRAAQKAYFKQRSQSNLKASLTLERRVDQALEEGIEIPEGMPKQLDMFATANTTKEYQDEQ